MAYKYTTIDGQRVEKNVAKAFKRWAKAFKKRFGLTLHVRSGTRTRAEQAELYRRYKAGTGSLAAPPGHSNHEESGPRGPRALDLYDSGKNAGVTVAGSARSNWLRATARKFGFDMAGFRFGQVEPWHTEFLGSLTSGSNKKIVEAQRGLNKQGHSLVVDGINGDLTKAAVKSFQNTHSLVVDGIYGPKTEASLIKANKPKPTPSSSKTVDFGRVDTVQRALKTKYPLYAWRLRVDNIDGPKTIKAVKTFQSRAGLTVDGVAGPKTRRKLGVK